MDLRTILLSFLMVSSAEASVRPTPSVIYGEDNRVESLEVRNPKLIEAAFSVAALVPFYDLYESNEAPDSEQSLEEQLQSVRGKVDEQTYNFLLELLKASREEGKRNSDEMNSDDNSEDDLVLKDIDKKMSNAALLRYHLSRILATKKHEPFYEFDQSRTPVSEFNICPSEKFSTQPILSMCTGFLVGKDKLVTAGHCIRSKQDCEDGVWVFEYFNGVKNIQSKNIYRCQKILSRKETDLFFGKDYAIIKLEREVTGRKPLKISKDRIKKKKNVAVIGHPLGLPMKTAVGEVTSSWFGPNLKTNLDTFVGNSGSPVLDTESGEVIGILVGGAEDFPSQSNGQCIENNRIYSKKGREKVMKISSVPGL